MSQVFKDEIENHSFDKGAILLSTTFLPSIQSPVNHVIYEHLIVRMNIANVLSGVRAPYLDNLQSQLL